MARGRCPGFDHRAFVDAGNMGDSDAVSGSSSPAAAAQAIAIAIAESLHHLEITGTGKQSESD